MISEYATSVERPGLIAIVRVEGRATRDRETAAASLLGVEPECVSRFPTLEMAAEASGVDSADVRRCLSCEGTPGERYYTDGEEDFLAPCLDCEEGRRRVMADRKELLAVKSELAETVVEFVQVHHDVLGERDVARARVAELEGVVQYIRHGSVLDPAVMLDHERGFVEAHSWEVGEGSGERARLRAVCEAATRGPWRSTDRPEPRWIEAADGTIIARVKGDVLLAERNAVFIAEARQALPRLLEADRSLRAELTRLQVEADVMLRRVRDLEAQLESASAALVSERAQHGRALAALGPPPVGERGEVLGGEAACRADRRERERLAACLGRLTPGGFSAAWSEMEARGYRYGREELEGVRLGWEMACRVAHAAEDRGRPARHWVDDADAGAAMADAMGDGGECPGKRSCR